MLSKKSVACRTSAMTEFNGAGLLNRTCAYRAHLESILLALPQWGWKNAIKAPTVSFRRAGSLYHADVSDATIGMQIKVELRLAGTKSAHVDNATQDDCRSHVAIDET